MSDNFLEQLRRRMRVRNDLLRCTLAEWFAVTIFVWSGTSTIAQATLSRGRASDHATVALGWGAAAALGTLIAHRTSGAHLSPAISLFYLSTQHISTARFFAYAGAQLVGAFFGAALTYTVYCDAIDGFEANGGRSVNGPTSTAHIFANYPAGSYISIWPCALELALGAAVLTVNAAALADRRTRLPAYAQPALVGVAYALVVAAFGWQSGAAPPNPAHDLGGRLYSALFVGYGSRAFHQRDYRWFLVPVVAPLAGALAGGWAYLLAVGLHVPSEIDDLAERVHRLHDHSNHHTENGDDKSECSSNNESVCHIDRKENTTTKATKAKPSFGGFSNNKNNSTKSNCNGNGNGNSSLVTEQKLHSVNNNNDVNDYKYGNVNNNQIDEEEEGPLVPRTISASRVALADPPADWHYSDLFADGNYVDLSAERSPIV